MKSSNGLCLLLIKTQRQTCETVSGWDTSWIGLAQKDVRVNSIKKIDVNRTQTESTTSIITTMKGAHLIEYTAYVQTCTNIGCSVDSTISSLCTCTPTQVANSDKSEAKSITGTYIFYVSWFLDFHFSPLLCMY